MKIVYCLPSTYRMGCVERIVSSKANLLSEMEHDVSIITTDQQGRQSYFKIIDKVKCYDLGINYEGNQKCCFVKNYYIFYNCYLHKKRLSQLLKRLKDDIVISTLFNEVSLLPQIKDGSKKL